MRLLLATTLLLLTACPPGILPTCPDPNDPRSPEECWGQPLDAGPPPAPDMGAPAPDGGGTLSGATKVNNCPSHPTLADMDRFFAARCGVDNACHGARAVWTDLASPNVYTRALDVAPKVSCSSGRLIDSRNPGNSILLIKAKQAMPACPPEAGDLPGTVMPPPMNAQKIAALTAAEVACLEGFVTAAAGR